MRREQYDWNINAVWGKLMPERSSPLRKIVGTPRSKQTRRFDALVRHPRDAGHVGLGHRQFCSSGRQCRRIVLRGSDVKRPHIMRCLQTSAGLQISRARHDGLQADEVTQGGSIVKDTTRDKHHDARCNNIGKSG